ncbi:hypothetical protein [Pseudomonas sp. DY-1]|uniref:hypothetical protein n=1 Tax=Pseudomonas sp. DY-1 TaxID=1755504 RepID=UPI0013C446D9|nr:hypothetical protein [Pseudomonas sp. DY-1]
MWLLVGSVAYWVRHGWLPNDVAAWVQAFGSIGAILAAIWISHRQGRGNERERQRREYHYMFKAFNMSAYASHAVHAIAGCLEADAANHHNVRLYFGRLKDAYAEVCKFAYPSFADLGFADHWIEHKRRMSLLIEEVERHLAGIPTVAEGAKNLAEVCDQAVLDMQAALERYSTTVGDKVWAAHHP